MPIPLVVTWTLARELLRALLFPLQLLLFLPRKRRWIERTRKALAEDRAPSFDDTAADFAELLRRPRSEADRPAHLLFSCGEASGELHASHLVETVRRRCATDDDLATPRITAFGGQRLQDLGVDVRFPLADQAIFGLAGVFQALPFILRAVAAFLRVLRDDRPDLVVLIDYPGLHVVFAELARRRGVPVLHYVAPQYWGWAPWRMRRYRRAVDASLTILPFEPAFFAAAGVRSAYIGHPLLDEVATMDEDELAEVCRLPTLVLMPGSRRKELEQNLRPLVAIADRLRDDQPDLRVVLPHRDPKRLARAAEILEELGARDRIQLEAGNPGPWLRGCRAAVVKSGTGSLEACLHGAPTVVVYSLDTPVARWVSHNLVTVPWVAAANLCAGRRIVPEFKIERPAQWNDVEQALRGLWLDGPTRAQCLRDLEALRQRLGEPGASERAARFVLPACERR